MTSPLRRLARRALGRTGTHTPNVVVPEAWLELSRRGEAPLQRRARPASGRLEVAIVVPSFRAGSGGHATIGHIARSLASRGHGVSLWLEDFEHRHTDQPAAETADRFADYFNTGGLTFHADFEDWSGADLVLATSWHTVPRVRLLTEAAGRAYLVQDHEPEFYAASAERLLAADTYRQGLPCIAASSWLAHLLRERYGAQATHFDLAVDASRYHPAADPARSENLVAFYARTATPRRAVPLGLLALEELARRRPEVEIALFGSAVPSVARFAHANLGVLGEDALAELYRRATIGMAFSLTNPSLVGLQMLASGLPCVELATEPMVATFGASGPLALVEPDPMALCAELERLLDDGAERDRRARAGLEFVAGRTWEAAAEQIEAGLLKALAGH